MALKVGELFASFNLDTSGVSGAVSSAEKQLSDVGKGLAIGGAGMTAAVTVPLKQAATAIYEAGTGFDAQMSKVFAIAGEEVTGSAKAMTALRDKALEMGSTTQFTAKEAGEAMEYMAMAGWKTGEMLAAIEPLMNLAAAAGEDLGKTSDIVTDAMTAFGLAADGTSKVLKDDVEVEVNNVAHFADVLAAASSNANTNVSMMGESFKYCGAIAGTMGYSVEDTAVALGIMANSGIKASQAGTSLRRIMTSLNGNIEISGKKLGKVTIATSNADGTMRSFSDILADCRKAFSQLTDSEKTAVAKNLVGQNAMSGFLTLMNVTEKDLNKLTSAIDNCTGAADEMADTMLDNAQGDVILFQSALEGLEVTLWELAEGSFRDVIQGATKVVDSFRKTDETTQKGALRMAALAAATGPVMAGMGGIIAFLPKLRKTFTALTGPAALLTIGMVALGAAAIDVDNTIGTTFVKGMTEAGKKVEELGQTVRKRGPELQSNMSAFLGSVTEGIEKGLPGMMNGLTGMLTTAIQALSSNMGNISTVAKTLVTTLATGIKDNLPELVPATVDLLTGIAAALIENAPTAVAGMTTVVTALGEELGKLDWSDIGTKLNTAVKNAWTDAETLFKQLAMGEQYTEDASWEDVGKTLVSSLMSGVQTGFGNVRDFVGGLLLGEDYEPDEDWSSYGEKIIDKIFETADTNLSSTTDFVSGILEGLADVFSEANISNAASSLSAIVSRLIGAAADEIPKLGSYAGTILSKIGELIFGKEGEKGLAASALDGATTLASSILSAVTEAIPKVANAGADILTKIGDLFTGDKIKDLAGSAASLAGAIIDGLKQAIPQVGNAALDIMTAIGGLFSGDKLTDFGDGAKTIARTLIEKIVEAIPVAFETAGKVVTGGAKLAAEIVGSIATALKDLSASGLVDDFAEATKGLVSQLLTTTTNFFNNNEDVKNFVTNLGEGIKASMGLLGDIAGTIVRYLLSKDALLDAWNVGKVLVTAIFDGVKYTFAGIGSFLENLLLSAFQPVLDWLETKLRELGMVPDDLPEMNISLDDVSVDMGMIQFEDDDPEKQVKALLMAAIANMSSGDMGDYISQGLQDNLGSITWTGGGLDLQSFVSRIFGGLINTKISGKTAREVLEEKFEQIGLKDAFISVADTLGDEFFASLEKNHADENAMAELYEQMFATMFSSDSAKEVQDEAEKAAEAAESSVEELYKEVMGTNAELAKEAADSSTEPESFWLEIINGSEETAEVVRQATDTVTEAVEEGSNQIAKHRYAGALTAGKGEAETAALNVSDAVVQQFLLTMSAENGEALAVAFIGGIKGKLEDGTLVAVAVKLADDTHNTLKDTLTFLAGQKIGWNFGAGLVDGISSMMDAVITAASNLGTAAADALSSSIQEGSPSRLTAETGVNFGLGFIGGILDTLNGAGDAALAMGESAALTLEDSVAGVKGMASDGMSVRARTMPHEWESASAQEEHSARAYVEAIADALNGAQVVMDGESVGRLVMPTVSELIAAESSARRWGTE